MPSEEDNEGCLISERRKAFVVVVEIVAASIQSEIFEVSDVISRRVGKLDGKNADSRDYVFLATEDGREVVVSSPGEDDDPVRIEVDGPVWVDPDYPITLAAFSKPSSAIAWSRDYSGIEPYPRPDDAEGCPRNLRFSFNS